MARGWTAEDIALVRQSPSKTMTQTDGASVLIREIGGGRYNVIIESENGVVTAMKNLTQKKLGNLAENYGWE